MNLGADFFGGVCVLAFGFDELRIQAKFLILLNNIGSNENGCEFLAVIEKLSHAVTGWGPKGGYTLRGPTPCPAPIGYSNPTGHPAGGDRCRGDRTSSWRRSMSRRPDIQLAAIDVEATGHPAGGNFRLLTYYMHVYCMAGGAVVASLLLIRKRHDNERTP
jgi:hypothetical protein